MHRNIHPEGSPIHGWSEKLVQRALDSLANDGALASVRSVRKTSNGWFMVCDPKSRRTFGLQVMHEPESNQHVIMSSRCFSPWFGRIHV